MSKLPFRVLAAAALAAFLLAGCGSDSDDAAPETTADTASAGDAGDVESSTTTSEAEPELEDAEDVLLALKSAGLPVGDYVAYTEETDENDLLGRPGQYTSKVNFHDTRLEEFGDFDTEGGGSVEMFDNEQDAQDRYEYVDAITSGSSMFVEYHWVNGTAFLRLGKSLTPSQADEYKAAFDDLDLG